MRLRIIVILAIAAAVAVTWVKLGSRRSASVAPEPAQPGPATTTATAVPKPQPPPVRTGPARNGTAPPGAATAADNTATSGVITNWPEKLDEILTSAEPEPKKAEDLFNLLPKLPIDGQEEIAQHMVNLLPDEQFPATARYINDTNTPETVITILMNDMLNRPSPVKLPMLLDLAQVTGHPLAEEARTILGVYVEQDYGDNWDQWRSAIADFIKKEAESMPPETELPATPGTPPVPPPPSK